MESGVSVRQAKLSALGKAPMPHLVQLKQLGQDMLATGLMAEILQCLGVYALGKTFDPLDVATYATGALIPVLVERAVVAKPLRSRSV